MAPQRRDTFDPEIRRAVEAEVTPVKQKLAILECTVARLTRAISALSPDCTLAYLLGAQERKLASKTARERREILEELRIG